MSTYRVWLAKFLTIIVMMLFVVPFMIGIVRAAIDTKPPGQVAVVELEGMILDTSDVLKSLYEQAKTDAIKSIVLRVNSPGGAVAPSEELYWAIMKIREKKPVVASLGAVAASGGFYAASAANKIFAQRGTQTGSIGVVLQLPNIEKVMDKVGVEVTTIKSGALKDVGNFFRGLSEPEKAYLEKASHRIHENFISAVASGRNLPVEKVRAAADGRMILGSEAKELGLIDEYGDIYDAARASLALAHVETKPDEMPKLVHSGQPKGFIERMLKTSLEIPAKMVAAVAASGEQFFLVGE